MSKSAWGGLRLGWIRATPQLVRELAATRADLDLASPVLEQLVAAELLARWEEVLASRRALLLPRRDALLAALAEHAPAWTVRPPHGGLSAWVRLPFPLATRLASAAARERVGVVPGPSFSADGAFEHFLRLPFTLPEPDLRRGGRHARLARRRGCTPGRSTSRPASSSGSAHVVQELAVLADGMHPGPLEQPLAADVGARRVGEHARQPVLPARPGEQRRRAPPWHTPAGARPR